MAMRLSRRQIAAYVAERLLADDAAIVAQLAAYLIDTNRTSETDLIVRDIETALAEAGVVVVDVATAHDLSGAMNDAIEAYIARTTGAHEVQVRATTDPSLIGGVRMTTPNAEYDATVRRKLTKLQKMKV